MASKAMPQGRIAGECLALAVRELHAAGVELPVLEAQILLAQALGVGRERLYLLEDRQLSAAEENAFAALLRERCARRPIAYVRGYQEFYGLAFEVDESVLVPRPETELLVDFAISQSRLGAAEHVVDAGTGSGCIAAAVAANTPAVVVGSDVSRSALRIAARNLERLGLGRRVCLVQADMLAAMRRHSADMILSNPPYIASDDLWNLQREILDHEPAVALDGGPDGLALHRQVAAGAAQALIAGGNLAVEVALGQAEDVVRVHEAAGFRHERTLRDLAGIDRVVVSRRMGE